MDLISEIKQSGEAMLRLHAYYMQGPLPAPAEALRALIQKKHYSRYIFTGMGSSDFAALPACQYLRKRGIDARTMESGEFLRFHMPPLSNTLVIAISQSGHSVEVVQLCEALSALPCDVVTVTNYEGNSMYAPGRITFPILAGTETKSSSKSYTNTIALLYYMALLIAGEQDFTALSAILQAYAGEITGVIAAAEQELAAIQGFLGDASYMPVIGGGPSYATASQAEILLMEISHIASARYTCGQFMHGTVELLSEAFRGILLDFQEETRADVDAVIEETVNMGGKLWLITGREAVPAYGEHVYVTRIASEGVRRLPLLSPILEIEPIILLTAAIAKAKGYRPGELRTVQK